MSGFVDAHFFADASVLLDNCFLTAERNVDVFAGEGLARRLRALGGNAFDLDFFAPEFDRLIHGFGPYDLAQANTAGFDLAFANLELFFRQGDGGFIAPLAALCLGLLGASTARTLQAVTFVIIVDLALLGFREFGTGIECWRVFHDFICVRGANDLTGVIHMHSLRGENMSSADEPGGS